jgi:hypothetical protein
MTNTKYFLQISQYGELAIPEGLCQRYNIQPGTTFHLVDLEGIFALVPFEPQVPALAHEIERLRIESGVPIEDLLQNLRQIRQIPKS